MVSQSDQYRSQEEGTRVLQEAAGQHNPNIIGNIEDEEFSAGMEVLHPVPNNNANERMMDLGSAPQYQKENMLLMDGSKVSPSKLSGRSKSPSKFNLGIYSSIPKS